MLRKLLNKELRLCLHPACLIMLSLCLLILIPNYPYSVSFFYVTLGLFFVSSGARENNDPTFSLTLPLARRDIVAGRFLLAVVIELLSLLLSGLIVWLHQALIRLPNGAGMEANLALLGEGFLLYGVFNLVFFPRHYRDVSRVGGPFVIASILLFLLVAADIALCYALPFWRDVLDTPDPAHLGVKALFLLGCALLYALLTLWALRLSQKRFAKLDLR